MEDISQHDIDNSKKAYETEKWGKEASSFQNSHFDNFSKNYNVNLEKNGESTSSNDNKETQNESSGIFSEGVTMAKNFINEAIPIGKLLLF